MAHSHNVSKHVNIERIIFILLKLANKAGCFIYQTHVCNCIIHVYMCSACVCVSGRKNKAKMLCGNHGSFFSFFALFLGFSPQFYATF